MVSTGKPEGMDKEVLLGKMSSAFDIGKSDCRIDVAAMLVHSAF